MTKKAKTRRLVVSAVEAVIGSAMVLAAIAAVCYAASFALSVAGVA